VSFSCYALCFHISSLLLALLYALPRISPFSIFFCILSCSAHTIFTLPFSLLLARSKLCFHI
jgi:hypothetical protein